MQEKILKMGKYLFDTLFRTFGVYDSYMRCPNSVRVYPVIKSNTKSFNSHRFLSSKIQAPINREIGDRDAYRKGAPHPYFDPMGKTVPTNLKRTPVTGLAGQDISPDDDRSKSILATQHILDAILGNDDNGAYLPI